MTQLWRVLRLLFAGAFVALLGRRDPQPAGAAVAVPTVADLGAPMSTTIPPAEPTWLAPDPPAPAAAAQTPAFVARLARAGVPTVVAAAAVVLALLWLPMLSHHNGDFGGFVYFGHYFEQAIHTPHGAPVTSEYGYDGQYFWRMAASPLLSDGAVLDALRGNEYRAQRIAYPTLAWLLAGGRTSAIPYTLQIIGWLSILGLVALMALTAVRYGRSAWWGLPLGLLPGMYLGMLRDVADPMSVTLLVAALVCLDRRRFALAGLAIAAAVLTRETMMVIPVALAASLIASRMTIPERLKPQLRLPPASWLLVAVGVAAFAAWEIYAATRLGRTPAGATPDQQFTGPMNALVKQVHVTARDVGNGGRFIFLAVANPVYLLGICAVSAIAFWAASQRLDVAAICAALFAVVGLTQAYGDHWSYTRATAPLFAAVAYLALQRGYQRTLVIIAAGALLLPMYPA